MLQNRVIRAVVVSLFTSISLAAAPVPTRSSLTAADVVAKNVAARGGLQAWRAVQTISMQGKLGVGGNRRTNLPAPIPGKKGGVLPTDAKPVEEVLLPFEMDMQRPHKVRFSLDFRGQTAVQIFDGANGWKLRPYLNRTTVEPYTADELKKASMEAELDGPLVDYQAKGTTIELDGTEKVEDRDTYKLKLTLKDGHAIHVWVDAQTFLETKMEGQPRRLDGVDHAVEVYFRDYRSVNGLKLPFVLETKVLTPTAPATKYKAVPVPTEKILVEKIALNPKVDAALFAKPSVQEVSMPIK